MGIIKVILILLGVWKISDIFGEVDAKRKRSEINYTSKDISDKGYFNPRDIKNEILYVADDIK